MYPLALIAAAVMIIMIYLFYHKQQKGRIYIAVIHYQGDEAGDEIIRSFGRMKYFIKSKTMRGEKQRWQLRYSVGRMISISQRRSGRSQM